MLAHVDQGHIYERVYRFRATGGFAGQQFQRALQCLFCELVIVDVAGLPRFLEIGRAQSVVPEWFAGRLFDLILERCDELVSPRGNSAR